MKKIFNLLALALCVFSLQSCLHDDDEVFDQSAAVRIQQSVEDVKAQLKSSPNGWLMHYFTGKDATGGGYTVFMRFTDEYAYVSADFAPADMVSKSTWDVKKDQGPVITFDTYNEIMHYMSNPSSGSIDGQKGDYEFVVLKMTEDSIYVRGKKWGNHMVMTRVAEDTDWSSVITVAQDVLDNIAAKYTTVGGTSLVFNTNSRRMTTSSDGVGTAFYTDAKGIHFYEPYTIDDVEVEGLDFTYDETKGYYLMSSEALGGAIEEVSVPLSEQFINGEWYLMGENMGATAASYFNAGATTLATKGEKIMDFIFCEFTTNTWGFRTDVTNGDSQAYVAMNLTYKIIDDENVSFSMGGSIWGGIEYWNTYGYRNFMTILNGQTYTIEAVDDEKKPSVLKLQNSKIANLYFYVTKNEVLFPFGE